MYRYHDSSLDMISFTTFLIFRHWPRDRSCRLARVLGDRDDKKSNYSLQEPQRARQAASPPRRGGSWRASSRINKTKINDFLLDFPVLRSSYLKRHHHILCLAKCNSFQGRSMSWQTSGCCTKLYELKKYSFFSHKKCENHDLHNW